MAFQVFAQGVAAAFVTLFLAGTFRLLRRWHVPYLVHARTPWGRKFDEASALKQNGLVVHLFLWFSLAFTAVAFAALIVGFVQEAA